MRTMTRLFGLGQSISRDGPHRSRSFSYDRPSYTGLRRKPASPVADSAARAPVVVSRLTIQARPQIDGNNWDGTK